VFRTSDAPALVDSSGNSHGAIVSRNGKKKKRRRLEKKPNTCFNVVEDLLVALEKYIRPDFILPSLISTEKEAVIRELLQPLIDSGIVRDAEKAYQAVLEREALCSTGLEGGIAVPHAKTDQAEDVGLVIGIHREGVEFDSLDGKLSRLFFLIICSPRNAEDHLNLLSEIGKIAVKPEIRDGLLNSETGPEVLEIIQGI